MKKIIGITLALILFSFSKCEKEQLKLERIDFTSHALRLDGFYYNNPNRAHFFLYRNGIFLDGGTGFKGSLSDIEMFYKNFDNYKTSYKLPYMWGVFRLVNEEIFIEKWVSSDAFGKYTTIEFKSQILNDTTLLINHPSTIIRQDTFYFHQFKPKPDSTNNFIK